MTAAVERPGAGKILALSSKSLETSRSDKTGPDVSSGLGSRSCAEDWTVTSCYCACTALYSLQRTSIIYFLSCPFLALCSG